MSDLELAHKTFFQKKLKLVIVKNSKILFSSKSSGITPLLNVAKEKLLYKGASSADKIIGSAASWIMIYAGIKDIFAKTISKEALKILKENKININYEKVVPFILNRTRTNLCPNEIKFLNIKDKNKAFDKISEILREI